MNIKELEAYLSSLPDKVMGDAAEIVAETATEYFKETFRKKAFDGNPWTPARTAKRRGSLLIESGAMMNSIRPLVVTAACRHCCGKPKGYIRQGAQRGLRWRGASAGTHPPHEKG